MTRSQKSTYLKIALNLQGVGINDEMADRIVETYEKVIELEGEFSLKDAVEIQYEMDTKYAAKRIKERQ